LQARSNVALAAKRRATPAPASTRPVDPFAAICGKRVDPTDWFFVQQILPFDIDTIGNHVDQNDGMGSLVSDGTLHAAAFLFFDISAAYRLWHEPPCSGRVVTGLARPSPRSI
jgi:hypothetical protein